MESESVAEIKRHFEVIAEGLRGEIRLVGEKAERRSEKIDIGLHDLRRHFDVIAEALRSDICLVAEGVAGLDEKSTLEFVRVRDEIAEQIGDVKSLIRASYGNLDRRVTALEKKPS